MMHPGHADREPRPGGEFTHAAQRYLEAAALRLPAMQAALGQHGQKSLKTYVSALSRPSTQDTPQDRQDLVQCVHRRCARLLGEQTAERAASSLAANATVLTANHHGVDFFAQSVQGPLALALNARVAQGAVVVLACGAIPLNNLTFPRGMLAYLDTDYDARQGPCKLPIFPDRFKRSLVCTTKSMDASMVERARERLRKMHASGKVAEGVVPTMDTILECDYASPEVLALESYSEQATVINHRLWRRMFSTPDRAPDLAYLELEALSTDLLCMDLASDSSLAWAALFDGELRERILSLLDGERACWNRASLARRNLATGAEPAAAGATGTVFFWGLDASNRRIPLSLTTSAQGITHLQGVADDGEQFQVRFDASSIMEALQFGRLLPSLFMSYLAIGMARGVNCLGGYYQAQYLPTMQNAVVSALQHKGAQDTARQVASTTTDAYLSGMQAVCTRNRIGGLIPAGPLEIIAAGGLNEADRLKMESLTVHDAHLASIVDTLMDAGRDLVGDGPWHVPLAQELSEILAERVVVKNL